MSASDNTIVTYLLLGSNLGDRVALLKKALAAIDHEVGTVSRASSVYETGAWGNENQPNYLNQVLQVATSLEPLQLLEKTQAIEKKMGRRRNLKWESRSIDIDILLYGDHLIDVPGLCIPHPLLPQRRFALVPLQEIAPMLKHPVSQKTITDLLDESTDRLPVQLYKTETYEHEV